MDRYIQEVEQLLKEQSSNVMERERTAFDLMLSRCENRVVFFGAGNLGRKALGCLRSTGVEPLAFADNSEQKWGTELDGVPVFSPQDAAQKYGASALFVVTVWSPGRSYRAIRSQLTGLGCLQVVPSSALRWKFAPQLLPDFWQDLPHTLCAEAEQVLAAAALWSDEYSRREYLSQVRLRVLGDFESLDEPLSDQYFPADIVRLMPGEVFVDCGAYDGDTARAFVARNPEYARLIAVEPDPANYDRLHKWRDSLEDHGRIETHNLAVGAGCQEVRFAATGAEGACVASNGDVVVQQITLDHLLREQTPTYVKMDIEGAELGALCGARQVLAKHRPMLAVCVYHKPDHLWRVPLFIRSLNCDYQFLLRPHLADGWDLVLYAIPASRMKLAG